MYEEATLEFIIYTGDWVISGGFVEEVTDTAQVTTQTVEIINANTQKAESDLPMTLAQHCVVHVYCYYTFFGGGTSFAGNIAMPIAYYHVYKSGNFHKLPFMKTARANHVCFAQQKSGMHKRIFVVGGRNWLQQVTYNNKTKILSAP